MKKLFVLFGIFTLFSLFLQQQAAAVQQPYLYEEPSYSDQAYEAEELEDLVAPIALYPDPLIAQLLPAATFIDQIEEAARYVRRYGVSPAIDQQPWDISVRAVAHYPDLLLKMDRDYDWTVSLGQAFINQQEDLFSAIQRLRADAYDLGNLVSTREQQVVLEGGYIRIYPADPRLIYLPNYDPRVIYVERTYPSYGMLTFGAGLSIGVWLNRDFDWYQHRIYYHGWRGDGWIGHARPYVHLQNRYYVQPRSTIITLNRGIVYHDTSRYRRELRHERQLRPPLAPRPASPLRERHAPSMQKAPEKRPSPPPAFQQPRPRQPDIKPQPPRVKDRAEELRAVKPTTPRTAQPHREQRGMQTAQPKQPSAVPAAAKPAVVRPVPAAPPPPAAATPAVKPPSAVPPASSKAPAVAEKERPHRTEKPEKQERSKKRDPQEEDRQKR